MSISLAKGFDFRARGKSYTNKMTRFKWKSFKEKNLPLKVCLSKSINFEIKLFSEIVIQTLEGSQIDHIHWPRKPFISSHRSG